MDHKTAAADEVMQAARFILGETTYAVDVLRIREVIEPGDITTIPGSPSFVDGLVKLRGEFLPVIDLRTFFGLLTASADDKAVVLPLAGVRCALVVDGVLDVVRISRREIQSVGGSEHSAVVGMVDREDGAVCIFEPDNLLSPEDEQALRAFAPKPD
jgi:purine-binding chemotaxis protein CheW